MFVVSSELRVPTSEPELGNFGGGMARMHVVLDDEVLKAIDQRVGPRGPSRFLEGAAKERLERLELEAAVREGAALLREQATRTGGTRTRSGSGFGGLDGVRRRTIYRPDSTAIIDPEDTPAATKLSEAGSASSAMMEACRTTRSS